MALERLWMPSPNYSSSRSRNQILCLHTSEGATTVSNLGNFLSQPSAGVSYQVAFDDLSPYQIGEYVKPHNKAWAAMNANDWGEHGCCCTPAGGANWSRTEWLTHDIMLRAAGAWLGEEAARYGIQSIPTLLYFSGGEVRDQTIGVTGKKTIVSKLDSLALAS